MNRWFQKNMKFVFLAPSIIFIVAMIIAIAGAGGLKGFGAGITALGQMPGEKSFWNMFSIGGDRVSSWIIASLLGACTAQAGLQPVLSAKNAGQARKACIITAFVAAPLRRLSATHQKLSPDLTEGSLRKRPTNTSFLPQA